MAFDSLSFIFYFFPHIFVYLLFDSSKTQKLGSLVIQHYFLLMGGGGLFRLYSFAFFYYHRQLWLWFVN